MSSIEHTNHVADLKHRFESKVAEYKELISALKMQHNAKEKGENTDELSASIATHINQLKSFDKSFNEVGGPVVEKFRNKMNDKLHDMDCNDVTDYNFEGKDVFALSSCVRTMEAMGEVLIDSYF